MPEYRSAPELVVRPGDRVEAAGHLVHRDDGDWLDLATISDLMFHPPDWKSDQSVRLVGIDHLPAAEAPTSDRFGWETITGIWQDEAIIVDGRSPYVQAPFRSGPLHSCAPPRGGWDASS